MSGNNKTVFLFSVLLIFLLTLPLAAGEPEGPHMYFAEERHDFGQIEGDTLLTHVFKFENTGDDTLRIYRVRSS
jgi:hypothetical protein